VDTTPQRLLTEKTEISYVASALASHARLDILQACRDKYVSISDMAQLLNMPQSTVTNHIQVLEKAGLVDSKSEPGRRGRQKLCKTIQGNICIPVPIPETEHRNRIEIDMPVGLFTRVHVSPPCGLASAAGGIGDVDFPSSFLLPERVSAGIVWFADGWVEYSFPRSIQEAETIEQLEISFEACSEAVRYNDDWPSDISVWINSVKVGTWTCLSDYGRPRGMLNPQWWPVDQSQYGELKTWQVNSKGTFLDGEKISEVTPEMLDLMKQPTFRLRIGVDAEARNKGGLNIFGSSFGNYEQGIKAVISIG
jgi:predicted transcriptional regulator